MFPTVILGLRDHMDLKYDLHIPPASGGVLREFKLNTFLSSKTTSPRSIKKSNNVRPAVVCRIRFLRQAPSVSFSRDVEA